MKKRIIPRAVFIALTALILVFIFIMSSKPADESDELSITFGYRLCELFKPGFKGLPESEKKSYASQINHFIRKAAHFTEFAVLGALFFTDFYLFDVRRTRCVIFGFLSGAAAAVFDEIHQIFVPGRAGMITDVLLDFAGVVTGCLLVFAVTLCFTAAVTRRPPKAVQ